MEGEEIFINLVKEVEESCDCLNLNEVEKINKSNKILYSVLSSYNSKFCYSMALVLLDKSKGEKVREFGAFLLYNTIKTTINYENYSDNSEELIDKLMEYVLFCNSKILMNRLLKCVCLLIIIRSIYSYDNLLIKTMEKMIKICNNESVLVLSICINLYNFMCDEFKYIINSKVNKDNFSRDIRELSHSLQILSFRIFKESNIDNKINILKCLDSWLTSTIKPEDLSNLVLVEIFECLLDKKLTKYSYELLNTIINAIDNKSSHIYGSFIKILLFTLSQQFQCLTIVSINHLFDISYIDEIHQNLVYIFMNFFSLLVVKINPLQNLQDKNFLDIIFKLAVRLTALDSNYTSPSEQQQDFPINVWGDILCNENVVNYLRISKNSYILIDLYIIFLHKITVFPWVKDNAQILCKIKDLKKEVAPLFTKLALIDVNTFVNNLYSTFIIYKDEYYKDMNKFYLYDSLIYVICSISDVLPQMASFLNLIQEILLRLSYTHTYDENFLLSYLTVIYKTTTFLMDYLRETFEDILCNLVDLVIKLQNDSNPKIKIVIRIIIYFLSKIFDKIKSRVKPSLTNRIFQIFGNYATVIIQCINNKEDIDGNIFFYMLKLLSRSVSCSFSDSITFEENYMSCIANQIIDLYEKKLLYCMYSSDQKMSSGVGFELSMIYCITHGLLPDTYPGKRLFIMIFNRFTNNYLLLNTCRYLSGDEIQFNYVVNIFKKLFYPKFYQHYSSDLLCQFLNISLLAIYEDLWNISSLLLIYVEIVYVDNPSIESVNALLNQVFSYGLKNLNPEWTNSILFITFLSDILKFTPISLIFEKYSIIENFINLVNAILCCACCEIYPELSSKSIKCLKKIIKVSFKLTTVNVFHSYNGINQNIISLLYHIISTILTTSFYNGSNMATSLYPILNAIYCEIPQNFCQLFCDILFSEETIPNSVLDQTVRMNFYVQFINDLETKQSGMDVFTNFCSTVSIKHKY